MTERIPTERRQRIVRLTFKALHDLMLLNDDTKIAAVAGDYRMNCAVLKIESAKFDPVPEHQQLPEMRIELD